MSTYNCKCGLAAMAPCLGFLRFHPFRSVGKIFQPLENDECTKGLRLQAEMLRSAEQGRSDDEKLNALAKARQIEKVVFPFSTRAQVWLIGQTCQQRATKYPKDRKHSGDLVLEPVALETRFFASSSGPARTEDDVHLLEHALTVRKAVLGGHHVIIAATLIDLALARESRGRRDVALRDLAQSIEIIQKQSGRWESFDGLGRMTDAHVPEDDFPGAVRPTGTYSVEGTAVTVRILLRRDGKTLTKLEVRGTTADLPELTARLAKEITAAAQR